MSAALALGAGLSLGGCGLFGGGSAYDGTGTAACPALPGGVVAQVAGDLSADGKGPGGDAAPPQSGSLPVVGQSTSTVRYSCQWATTDGDTGLQVYVRESNAPGVREAEAYLRQQQGPELAAPVSGYGRAFRPGGTGSAQARWVCDYRTLQVDVFSPKDGTDPVTGARRLAEALVPRLGCPPA